MIDILDGRAIYERVDALRQARGWTIYELAKKAAVTPMTIYHWRDRHSSPTLSLLDSVCSAFEISVIDFLTDEEECIELTTEQREVIRLWSRLSTEQRKSVVNLMKSMT